MSFIWVSVTLNFAKCISDVIYLGICDLEYYNCIAVLSMRLKRKIEWPRSPLTLGDLSCAVYNASDFAAGEQSRRQSASVSSESLALFSAEENSFYVGSFDIGAVSSMSLRQYGFGDMNFNRASDYSVVRSGFRRTFFSGFVNGANAYYLMADGDSRDLRGLRVLRTCDSSNCTSTPCMFKALYELNCGSGTFPQGSLICGLSVLASFAGVSDTTVVLARCNTGTSGRNHVCSFRLADIDNRMNTYYTQCAGGTGEIELTWESIERQCSSGFLVSACFKVLL